MYFKNSKKRAFIGEGAFGSVYKILKKSEAKKSNPNYFAAKEMNDVEENIFADEYKIMKLVKHPNIVEVIGAVKRSSNSFILILEFCKHKSLQDLIDFK